MHYNLLLGALLHDIGKLIYRSLQDRSIKKDYRHQELGAAWAREQGLGEEITTIIQRHHRLRAGDAKYKDLSVDTFQGEQGLQNDLYTVDIADNIASGMERQKDREGGEFNPDIPLRSIFDLININKEKIFNGVNYWDMVPLSRLPYPKEKVAATDYHSLWQGFNEGFKGLGSHHNEEKLLSHLQN